MVGASVFLALPGNSTLEGVLGDVVGHFFSAAPGGRRADRRVSPDLQIHW